MGLGHPLKVPKRRWAGGASKAETSSNDTYGARVVRGEVTEDLSHFNSRRFRVNDANKLLVNTPFLPKAYLGKACHLVDLVSYLARSEIENNKNNDLSKSAKRYKRGVSLYHYGDFCYL